MPRESVYQGDTHNSVEVQWGRDNQFVTVGARFADKPFRFVDVDGHPIEGGTIHCGAGDVMGFDSLHVVFEDRRQLNDLIRLLRRARDSAFGADA